MPPVTIGNSRLSLTADLPPALTQRLRAWKQRLTGLWRSGGPDGPGSGEGSTELGRLVVEDHPPALRLERRRPYASLDYFRATAPRPVEEGADGQEALQRRVDSISWYHTIELPGGMVTPGFYDHRRLVPHYGIPDDLNGLRVLDVASADGFWAFEFERRGGDVTSFDVPSVSGCDLPPQARAALLEEGLDRDNGAGFWLAHEALVSKVKRFEGSVYDLDPDQLGTFDFVHAGDVLLHLESPIAALRGIRRVTSGTALIADCFDRKLQAPGLTRYLGGWEVAMWWMPGLQTLAQMVVDAGFPDVQVHALYSLAPTNGASGPWRASLVAT